MLTPLYIPPRGMSIPGIVSRWSLSSTMYGDKRRHVLFRVECTRTVNRDQQRLQKDTQGGASPESYRTPLVNSGSDARRQYARWRLLCAVERVYQVSPNEDMSECCCLLRRASPDRRFVISYSLAQRAPGLRTTRLIRLPPQRTQQQRPHSRKWETRLWPAWITRRWPTPTTGRLRTPITSFSA